MTRTVYKICEHEEVDGVRHYYSSVHSHFKGLSVEYKIDEKVVPVIEGTPLFTFKDLSTAISWTVHRHDVSILECAVEEEEVYPVQNCRMSTIDMLHYINETDMSTPRILITMLKREWKITKEQKSPGVLLNYNNPHGTVLVSSLRVVSFVMDFADECTCPVCRSAKTGS